MPTLVFLLDNRIYRITRCNLFDQVISDCFLEPGVEPLAMFVQHHGVRIAIELLETEARVVFLLDLDDGVSQQLPDIVHQLVVHVHRERFDPHVG